MRAGPDSALVIRRASNPGSARVVRRNASTFMWVLAEKSERLTLEVLRAKSPCGTIEVQVRDDEASILRAAERFRGDPAMEIRAFAVAAVDRAVRSGASDVAAAADKELREAGLKLVSYEGGK